jgi:hypothetical protein
MVPIAMDVFSARHELGWKKNLIIQNGCILFSVREELRKRKCLYEAYSVAYNTQ